MPNMTDLVILAAEPSGDLHGAKLIESLLRACPDLKIAAMAGPRMRRLPIDVLFPMENLQVMGFIDVLASLPRIVKQFFAIRSKILTLNPKAVICIDYPGFNLRLEQSLRKKGYVGKLIHYICPSVWAWGKKRIPRMVETLDLLLTIFPFEKDCFASTSLHVNYVGHPLVSQIPSFPNAKKESILALFPGSREKEILRNFPMQLRAAFRLARLDPSLKIGVSIALSSQEPLLRSLAKDDANLTFYPSHQNYELMKMAKVAIAKSGTVTIELALHKVPTVVGYAIRPIDLFIAQKIFRIHLSFYCIVNIILSKRVFPELFGPEFTDRNLDFWIQKFWFNEKARAEAAEGCAQLRQVLGDRAAGQEAAKRVIAIAF